MSAGDSRAVRAAASRLGSSSGRVGIVIRWVWSLTRSVAPGWFSREHLKFLYRGLGVRRAALWLTKEIARPVYYRERCYVVTHEVGECENGDSAAGHSRGLEHHIVESAQSLSELQVHIPPHRRQ